LTELLPITIINQAGIGEFGNLPPDRHLLPQIQSRAGDGAAGDTATGD